MPDTVRIRDIAKVVRSKNAGPFEITFDVLFDRRDLYEHVKASGAVTRESLGALYGVSGADITNFQFFDPALAFKLTIRRPVAQGSVGEIDTFGAQQHAPLLDLRVPAPRT
ncbi:DUF4387 domain-containing protein [Lichenicoccus sp.]|uniref:DUF4387 domain-containing protein n=1 Tax=Lichenicoccus sp. TaxID=2781899 RepID=UPI003D138298